MPNESSLPRTYIKNIALQLPENFRLTNSPYPADEETYDSGKVENKANQKSKDHTKPQFIGHKENIDKFVKFLESGNGVFLVTGFRGMGKTSFVNKVICDFKTNNNSMKTEDRIIPLDIHLTLAQNNPKELDILRLMTSSARDKYTQHLFRREYREKELNTKRSSRLINYFLPVIFLLLIVPFLLIIEPQQIANYITNPVGTNISIGKGMALLKLVSYYMLIIGFISILFYIIRLSVINYRRKFDEDNKNHDAYERLDTLNDRCYASLTHENSKGESLNLMNKLFSYVSSANEKKVKQYPIASAKEIEYELRQILNEAKKEKIKFIFIFDELDKIDSAVRTSLLQDDVESSEKQKAESDYQIDVRNRKQAVINVIAGLKNFFTSAAAHFIFIAGREMFDASLADIADRQSSISSIFTYIFNIDSLFKTIRIIDQNDAGRIKSYTNNSSLSFFIEEYVKCLLFCNVKHQSLYTQINEYRLQDDASIEGLPLLAFTEEFGKLYFIMQNFITYLTYRSNGSPKKMIKAIQEFIVVREAFVLEKNVVFVEKGSHVNEENGQCYLYFNYLNQYKIGFLSYLYRPFLIQFGRSLKSYSDNINVSTPYIFDHLIKFHPFAFSISNLELIPEVLATNKNPSLREHVKQIINHLAANHIRETEIGLFDYKFYSQTRNEIAFLSKVFEQEAAAFNFTLDESHMVKLQMIGKIKELRNTYAKFAGGEDNGQGQQIYSIALINGILGDLHFFDQEYEDAVAAYSDGIRQIDQQYVEGMNMRDFFTLIKNKLKLGLCFEKMSSYEESLAFYTDCCQDARNFINWWIRAGDYLQLNVKNQGLKKGDIYYDSALSDTLKIIVQCFLAKSIVQEKMSIDGLNGSKISIDLGSFLYMVYEVSKISDRGIVNDRSLLITANGYLITGKLLYYKNSFIGIDRSRLFKDTIPLDALKKITDLILKYNENFLVPVNKRKPELALYFYIIGLSELMYSRDVVKDLVDKVCNHKNISYGILSQLEFYIKDKNDQRFTGLHFSEMGTFLSNIGDCLLSMYIPSLKNISANNPEKKDFSNENNLTDANCFKNFKVSDLFNLSDYEIGNKTSKKFEELLHNTDSDSLHMVDILRCYYLSGQCYLKYGISQAGSFQYRKILWIFKLILNNRSSEIINTKFIDFLEDTIVTPLLRITSRNTEHSENHMSNKAKKYGVGDAYIINNLSNHPETREIILLFNYTKLRMGNEVNIIKLISPYNSFASQYARMLELDFYATYLYYSLKNVINEQVWSYENAYAAFEYLFSMNSILRILKIYGTEFVAGHSYYAYTHYRIANFLNIVKDCYLESVGVGNEINRYLKEKIDSIFQEHSYAPTDSGYHFQMANDLYERTIQLHTAGKEYHKVLKEMIYLEDDFNDNAYHFGAAFERYIMINGAFDDIIDKCSAAIKGDPRFSPDTYLSNPATFI